MILNNDITLLDSHFKSEYDKIEVFHFHINIYRWKSDLDSKCSLPGDRRVPAILVCNKSDLPRDQELPDDIEISRYVQENGFAPKWFKTSAKTGENVEETLSLIIR